MAKHLFASVAVVATALSLSSAAHAEDVSLHFNTGAAIPAVGSQFNSYKVGLGGDMSLQLPILRNLTVGPQIAAVTMEPREGSTYRQHAGDMWSFELATRLQGNHDSNAWLSPWIGVSGGVGLIGRLAEPVVDVSVGLDLATSKDHTAYLGVFAKGTHAFVWLTGDNTNLITHGDPLDVLTLGLSGTFDFPGVTRTKTVTVTKPELIVERVPVFINEGARTNPPTAIAAAPCPPSAKAPINLTTKVYFDRGKSNLDWQDKDKLDAIVAELKSHPDDKVAIRGFASPDGPMAVNQVLSQARTAAVITYLISQGVDAARLKDDTQGVDSKTAKGQEGTERARRVEFTVQVTRQ